MVFRLYVGKAEVTDRLWGDVLDAAKAAGSASRGCTEYILTITDVEAEDTPVSEEDELMEEEHVGGD